MDVERGRYADPPTEEVTLGLPLPYVEDDVEEGATPAFALFGPEFNNIDTDAFEEEGALSEEDGGGSIELLLPLVLFSSIGVRGIVTDDAANVLTVVAAAAAAAEEEEEEEEEEDDDDNDDDEDDDDDAGEDEDDSSPFVSPCHTLSSTRHVGQTYDVSNLSSGGV